jgi:DNA-binding IclR family transcriptional regulator
MPAPTVPPVAPIALLAAERKLVARFRTAHATVPERAIDLSDLKGMAHRRLQRLARSGVVHETKQGHWYLNEAVYSTLNEHRRRMAAIVIVAAILAGIAVYFLPMR